MMNQTSKKITCALLLLLLALASVLVASKYASSVEFHEKTISSLDKKKTTVMELTAAAAAVSTAITVIPGDTATPIAEKIADLSSYFLLVLCALYLEKYLLTITGYATFMVLLPLACALGAVNLFLKKEVMRTMIHKLLIFGIAIVLIVPVSVQISNLIETTYQSSIEATIEDAKQTSTDIETATDSGDENLLSGIISKVTDGVSNAASRLENVLNNFIEAVAVMVVTSCIIPIVVILFFVWLTKTVLGMDVGLRKKEE